MSIQTQQQIIDHIKDKTQKSGETRKAAADNLFSSNLKEKLKELGFETKSEGEQKNRDEEGNVKTAKLKNGMKVSLSFNGKTPAGHSGEQQAVQISVTKDGEKVTDHVLAEKSGVQKFVSAKSDHAESKGGRGVVTPSDVKQKQDKGESDEKSSGKSAEKGENKAEKQNSSGKIVEHLHAKKGEKAQGDQKSSGAEESKVGNYARFGTDQSGEKQNKSGDDKEQAKLQIKNGKPVDPQQFTAKSTEAGREAAKAAPGKGGEEADKESKQKGDNNSSGARAEKATKEGVARSDLSKAAQVADGGGEKSSGKGSEDSPKLSVKEGEGKSAKDEGESRKQAERPGIGADSRKVSEAGKRSGETAGEKGAAAKEELKTRESFRRAGKAEGEPKTEKSSEQNKESSRVKEVVKEEVRDKKTPLSQDRARFRPITSADRISHQAHSKKSGAEAGKQGGSNTVKMPGSESVVGKSSEEALKSSNFKELESSSELQKQEESKSSEGRSQNRMAQTQNQFNYVRREISGKIVELARGSSTGSGRSQEGGWQRQRIQMGNGQSLDVAVRQSGGKVSIQLGSLSSDLAKLLQNHFMDLKSHLEEQLSSEVELEFGMQEEQGGDLEEGRQPSGGSHTSSDDGRRQTDPFGDTVRNPRFMGTNQNEWTG